MNLKSIRKEKGYTLKEVSEGTGLPERSLAYWEKGERQPAADVLPKLAEFFKISVDELLDVKTPNVPAVEEVFEKESPSGHGYMVTELIVPDSKVEDALFNECEKVKKSFFKIGYYLTLIDTYQIYKRQGYASITDYAEDKFGIGSTRAYDFMQVYERTKKFKEPTKMDEKFLPFNQSQLVELSRNVTARDDLMRIIKPTDTVKDIQAYVKLWNKSYDRRGIRPEGATVKEALEIAAEEEKKKAIPAPTVVESESNACPGQTSIFDKEDEQEFYSFVPQGESYSYGSVSTAFVDMSEPEEAFDNEGEPEPAEETFVQNDKPETPLKELFRAQVQEFLLEYDYRIELYGRAQGAYGFAGSLFEYLKGKGFFDKI